MLSKERYARIRELIGEKGAVTTAELMDLFQVSFETVRRDLSHLEKQGILQRVHGGAVPTDRMGSYNRELSERLGENRLEKEELAGTAAMLVEEDDIVGIDAGSTAIYFAEALRRRLSRLTVLTYSMDVFHILSQRDGFQVILCGGGFLKSEKAFYGQIAMDVLKKIHIRKAFVCPSSISLRNGVGDFSYDIVPLQLQLISGSDHTFFLADSQKFETSGLLKICDMNTAHVYITDSGLNPQHKQLYFENDMRVISNQRDALSYLGQRAEQIL